MEIFIVTVVSVLITINCINLVLQILDMWRDK